jgi:hypothetical protein
VGVGPIKFSTRYSCITKFHTNTMYLFNSVLPPKDALVMYDMPKMSARFFYYFDLVCLFVVYIYPNASKHVFI